MPKQHKEVEAEIVVVFVAFVLPSIGLIKQIPIMVCSSRTKSKNSF